MTQLKLFEPEHVMAPEPPPDLVNIRKSLNRLLRLAREAEILPWSEPDAASWEKLFPQLAALLPAEEGAPMVSAFNRDLARLRAAR